MLYLHRPACKAGSCLGTWISGGSQHSLNISTGFMVLSCLSKQYSLCWSPTCIPPGSMEFFYILSQGYLCDWLHHGNLGPWAQMSSQRALHIMKPCCHSFLLEDLVLSCVIPMRDNSGKLVPGFSGLYPKHLISLLLLLGILLLPNNHHEYDYILSPMMSSSKSLHLE